MTTTLTPVPDALAAEDQTGEELNASSAAMLGSDKALAYIHPDLRPLAVPVSSLRYDPRNARLHDKRNLAAIAESLRRFGFRNVVVCQRVEGGLMVRAGEGRIEAAKSLGWTHVPVLAFDDSDHQAAAFALADNKTGDLSKWDYEVLASVVRELKETDATSLVGWLESEVDVFTSVEFRRPEVDPSEYDQQGTSPGTSADQPTTGELVLTGEAAMKLAAAAEEHECTPEEMVLELLASAG